WFRTDLNAARGRVVEIDITKPDRKNWKEIIPQASETLREVSMINNQFLANYLKDAHSQVKIFSSEGKYLREIELPGLGSASGFSGRRKDSETFYSFTRFITPGTIYRYALKTGATAIVRQAKVECNESQLETKQVFYHSRDGT